jgi:hypothetical protein
LRALGAVDACVVRFNMVLRLVRVLALLMAACLAPSLACAHAGHAHNHAGTPQDMTVAVGHHDQGRMVAAVVVKAAIASTAQSAGDPEPAGCAGHCCGAVTGMPCCSAVLVPEIIAAPDITISRLVGFARADALQGLPAKALPKPPKLLG